MYSSQLPRGQALQCAGECSVWSSHWSVCLTHGCGETFHFVFEQYPKVRFPRPMVVGCPDLVLVGIYGHLTIVSAIVCATCLLLFVTSLMRTQSCPYSCRAHLAAKASLSSCCLTWCWDGERLTLGGCICPHVPHVRTTSIDTGSPRVRLPCSPSLALWRDCMC